MPTSANCPKNPSDVRADVGIRAPILPLSQQPLASLQIGFALQEHCTCKENRILSGTVLLVINLYSECYIITVCLAYT